MQKRDGTAGRKDARASGHTVRMRSQTPDPAGQPLEHGKQWTAGSWYRNSISRKERKKHQRSISDRARKPRGVEDGDKLSA